MPHSWRDVQGQVGWDPGQPDLVSGDPVHGSGLQLVDLWRPFQPKPFYDSMILWFYDSVILWFYDSMILWSSHSSSNIFQYLHYFWIKSAQTACGNIGGLVEGDVVFLGDLTALYRLIQRGTWRCQRGERNQDNQLKKYKHENIARSVKWDFLRVWLKLSPFVPYSFTILSNFQDHWSYFYLSCTQILLI